MSIPIEAPPERPGHAGHTPQPGINLGLSRGRLHDLAGGLFGSGVVRALTGAAQAFGVLPVGLTTEYAMQPFGIPGRSDGRADPPTPKQQAQAHAHTLLSLEEATYKFGRGGNRQSSPDALRSALSAFRNGTVAR